MFFYFVTQMVRMEIEHKILFKNKKKINKNKIVCIYRVIYDLLIFILFSRLQDIRHCFSAGIGPRAGIIEN